MADFLRQIFAAAASIFMMVSLDPKLTLASLFVLPAVMLPTRSEEHTSELQSLRHIVSTFFPSTTLFRSQIFAAAASIFMMVSLDPKLTLASLFVLPAVMLPTTRVGRRIRRISRGTQERQAELNQVLQEALSGHMVVRAFAAEGYESGRFRAAARRLLKTNARYVLQQGLSSPMIDMLEIGRAHV